MNQNPSRIWNVLSWNVHGINFPSKWNAIRDKVCASNCDVVYFQETKKEFLDLAFIKNVCPLKLINLSIYPQLVLQEVCLLPGKALYLWVNCYSTMIMP